MECVSRIAKLSTKTSVSPVFSANVNAENCIKNKHRINLLAIVIFGFGVFCRFVTTELLHISEQMTGVESDIDVVDGAALHCLNYTFWAQFEFARKIVSEFLIFFLKLMIFFFNYLYCLIYQTPEMFFFV